MFEVSKSFIFLLIFLFLSITASVIDIKQKKIPDWIVFPGIIILTGFRIIFFEDLLYVIAINIITGPVLFFIVYFLTHGKLGMGDIKYSALMGVFTGLPGLFVAIGLASILGLLFAVAGLTLGIFHLKTKIPFAPFLSLGSFLSFLIINPIY
jgi:leader peptidase (prepilin peptidase) / N-methyltransferase